MPLLSEWWLEKQSFWWAFKCKMSLGPLSACQVVWGHLWAALLLLLRLRLLPTLPFPGLEILGYPLQVWRKAQSLSLTYATSDPKPKLYLPFPPALTSWYSSFPSNILMGKCGLRLVRDHVVPGATCTWQGCRVWHLHPVSKWKGWWEWQN